MAVHNKIGTFHHDRRAKLTTWIFEIAKNRAIDYHRASSHLETELTYDIPQKSPLTGNAHVSRNSPQLDWLIAQLNELSEDDRQLLKWRALEIPYSQLAEWLGLTEGNARVRHKRAMQKLLSKAKNVVDVPKGAVRS